MIYKLIEIPIYNYELLVIIGATREEVKDKFEFSVNESLSACVFIVEDNNGSEAIAVFFEGKEIKTSEIAHEAFHISNRIFDGIGYNPEKREQGYDEPQAYLIQYLVELIQAVAMGVNIKEEIND